LPRRYDGLLLFLMLISNLSVVSVLNAQHSRLDDQRSAGPAPVVGVAGTDSSTPDESFFDMLVAVQNTRLDEQRSPAPQPGARANAEPQAGVYALSPLLSLTSFRW
jgi:hypothetical protein